MGALRSRAASGAASRWLWSQRWLDLLFAHWRVPAESLRPHVAPGLEIDTCDGTAWVSAVAFRLDRVRRRRLPPVWPASAFPELNLRTYVRHGNDSAIFFLSIHAGRWLATSLARRFTPLPYVYAPIRYHRREERYRFHCPGPGFDAEWTPAGPAVAVVAGSVDAWLLERYVLYVEDERGNILRTDVEHPRWLVRRARLMCNAGALGQLLGLGLGAVPDAAHFSAGVPARVWPFAAPDARQPEACRNARRSKQLCSPAECAAEAERGLLFAHGRPRGERG
jgi:uncharacterized protein YqjF (DUF2071 family)